MIPGQIKQTIIPVNNAESSVLDSVVSPLILRHINFLVVTDVHSWVNGHKHNATLDADYGDVVSFYERLKIKSNLEGKDLFFLMNGDFIDGTGFSSYPPNHLTPILQKMPWDALNIGNHELYRNSTVEYITQPDGFVNFWRGGYLTSNVILKETGVPIGNRSIYLQGVHSDKTILVFGFLYNFQNHCSMTEVEDVETVINSAWFENELKKYEENGTFDAIVVLAHMDAYNDLVDKILNKIRSICGQEVPVQFITGHSHQRKFRKLDNFSTSFEAGRFLDTVGFTSIAFDDNDVSFDHAFIDGNINSFKDALGSTDDLDTENGTKLALLIEETEMKLGLNEVKGCSPKTFYLNYGLEQDNSLWGLFAKKIIPIQLFNRNSSKVFIQNPGGLRYNLYEGEITVNDVITVSPYNDTVWEVASNISGTDFITAFGVPNQADGSAHFSDLPKLIVSGSVDPEKQYDVYSVDFDVAYVKDALENSTKLKFEPFELDQSMSTILVDYIKTETVWQCKEQPEEELEEEKTWQQKFIDFFESFTVVKVIAFIMTFFVILFFGWMFLCRHPHQRLTDEDSLEDEASFGDNSGNDFSTCSDDDGSLFPVSAKTPSSYNGLNSQKSYHSFSDEHAIV